MLLSYYQKTNITILYFDIYDKIINYSIYLHDRYMRYQDTLKSYLIKSDKKP